LELSDTVEVLFGSFYLESSTEIQKKEIKSTLKVNFNYRNTHCMSDLRQPGHQEEINRDCVIELFFGINPLRPSTTPYWSQSLPYGGTNGRMMLQRQLSLLEIAKAQKLFVDKKKYPWTILSLLTTLDESILFI